MQAIGQRINSGIVGYVSLLVENVFVITPDIRPVTSICHIPTLQGVEKTCSPGASADLERKPHETSKGYEAMYPAPCEEEARDWREEKDRELSPSGAPKPLGSPGRDLTLGLPATWIFFLPHTAAVGLCGGHWGPLPDVWAADEIKQLSPNLGLPRSCFLSSVS